MSIRNTIPAGRPQGPNEDLVYTLDTTRWGGSPSSVTIEAIRQSDGEDVVDIVTPNDFPVTGDNISIRIRNLTLNEFYTFIVSFTTPTQPMQTAEFTIPCE